MQSGDNELIAGALTTLLEPAQEKDIAGYIKKTESRPQLEKRALKTVGCAHKCSHIFP